MVNRKKEVGGIASALVALVLFLGIPAVFGQDIVVEIQSSSSNGFDVISLQSNELFNGTEEIDLGYIVSYTYSNSVNCSASVNNNIIDTVTITNGSSETIQGSITSTPGTNTLNISCEDSLANQEDLTETYTSDQSAPVITVSPSQSTYNTTSVNFSYEVSDDFSSSSSCTFTLKEKDSGNQVYVSPATVQNGSQRNETVSSLNYETYTWTVTCSDSVKNTATTAVQEFSVEESSAFSLTLDEDSYDLGDTAVLLLNAESDDDVTLLITEPNQETTLYNYDDPFPRFHFLDLNYVGNYSVKAFKSENNQLVEIERSIIVANTITVDFDGNDSALAGESETYSVDATGGLGSLNYTWDFDDGSDEVYGEDVKHTFTEEGNYDVNVTVTDDYGNQNSLLIEVDVSELYNISFEIIDKETYLPINNALVTIGVDLERTDSKGKASFDMERGTYEVVVNALGYTTIERNNFKVEEDKETVFYLTIKGEGSEEINSTSLELSNEFLSEINTTAVKDALAQEEVISEPIEPEKSTLDKLLSTVQNAQKTLEIIGPEEKKAEQAIGVEKDLIKAKTAISTLIWDLEFLASKQKSMTNAEFTKEREEVNQKIEDIKSSTMSSLTIADRIDLSNDFAKVELEQQSLLLFEKRKGEEEDQQKFLRYNRELQDQGVIKHQITKVNIEYLDGSFGEKLIVSHIVEEKGDEEDIGLLITLPSSIPRDNETLEILAPHDVLNEQTYFFSMKKLKEARFVIHESSLLSDVKDITAIVSVNPRTFDPKKAPSMLTGMISLEKLPYSDNPIILLEIIVIGILVIAYICYECNVFGKKEKKKGKSSAKKKASPQKLKELGEKHPLKAHVQSIKELLQKGNADESEEKYHELQESYRELSAEHKKEAQGHVKSLYNTLLFVKIMSRLKLADELLEKGEQEQAVQIYQEIQEIYKDLAHEERKKVEEQCKDLYRKIVGE